MSAPSMRSSSASVFDRCVPVAMKIDSPDITHKSEVAGVRLNVAGAQAVQDTWQEIVDEVTEIDDKWRAAAEAVEAVSIRLEATDVRVTETRLVWVPLDR